MIITSFCVMVFCFIYGWVVYIFIMRLDFVSSVVVDSHESDRYGQMQSIGGLENFNVTKELLEYGDYLFNNEVVWEFKLMEDFVSSVLNETLFNEVYNQSEHYTHSFLIIVWDEKVLPSLYYKNPSLKYRFPNYNSYKYGFRNQLKGAIRRCRVVCNVVLANSVKEAFYEMIKQSDKCLSNKNYAGIVRKHKENYRVSPMLSFLTSIYGVGLKTGERIISEFNIETLTDLLKIHNADLKEHGFNSKVCKNYEKYVHGEQ